MARSTSTTKTKQNTTQHNTTQNKKKAIDEQYVCVLLPDRTPQNGTFFLFFVLFLFLWSQMASCVAISTSLSDETPKDIQLVEDLEQHMAKKQRRTEAPESKQEEKEDMSEEQQRALLEVRKGSNLFFTGVAGTGKSFLLKKIVEDLKLRYAVCLSSFG